MLTNVVDLDAAGRILGMKAAHYNNVHSRNLPSQVHSILAFFDFAAAFPSVMHQWIFLVLKNRKFPDGFINFIETLYVMNCALGSSGCHTVFLYWYFSGVLQGCPASAFVFDVSLDPFLVAFDVQVAQAGRGLVRACADDVGAALASYRHLEYLFPIFARAKDIAGLVLNPPKCNIVLTSTEHNENIALVV